jgi:hypothetical protein
VTRATHVTVRRHRGCTVIDSWLPCRGTSFVEPVIPELVAFVVIILNVALVATAALARVQARCRSGAPSTRSCSPGLASTRVTWQERSSCLSPISNSFVEMHLGWAAPTGRGSWASKEGI